MQALPGLLAAAPAVLKMAVPCREHGVPVLECRSC